jgi:hypothetical protein
MSHVLALLREIRLLYRGLVDRLIPVAEPLEDEKKVVKTADEVVGEEEVIEALE